MVAKDDGTTGRAQCAVETGRATMTVAGPARAAAGVMMMVPAGAAVEIAGVIIVTSGGGKELQD